MAKIYINSSGTWQNTWGGGYSTTTCYCSGACAGGCTNCYGCTSACNNCSYGCMGSVGQSWSGCSCQNNCEYGCSVACYGCSGSCGSSCSGYCTGGSGYQGSQYGTTTTYVQISKIKSNTNGTFKVPNNLRLNVANTWKTLSK